MPDVTLADIKQELAKIIYLLDDSVVDVTMAMVVANQIPGDSISMHLVGPSSSAKTEIVRTLIEYGRAYHPSKVTAHTFTSGFQVQGKKKSGDEPDKSLLIWMKQQGKNILVFKDFTSILTMNSEARGEVMSQIREISDGYMKTVYGTGEHIDWEGRIGVLSAVTNAIDEYSAVSESLGERFLKYRLTAEMGGDIAEAAISSIESKDAIRNKIAKMVNSFLMKFDLVSELPKLEDPIRMKLKMLAVLTSRLRSQLITNQYTNVFHTPPVLEGPGRMVTFLAKMGYSLALIKGLPAVDDPIYVILKKIARDTIHQYRILVLHALYNNEKLNTKEVADLVKFSYASARKYTEELNAIGVISKLENTGGKGSLWRLNPEYMDFIHMSEIFVMDKI